MDIGVNSHAAQLVRLYQIAFGREPDAAGLGFWVRAMDRGVHLNEVAAEFARCGEFQQLHGASSSSQELVHAFYRKGLGREGDQAGHEFWSGVLDRGAALGDVLVGFSESAENQAKLVGAVSHGVEYLAFG
jgi:hypothetical protein